MSNLFQLHWPPFVLPITIHLINWVRPELQLCTLLHSLPPVIPAEAWTHAGLGREELSATKIFAMMLSLRLPEWDKRKCRLQGHHRLFHRPARFFNYDSRVGPGLRRDDVL